MARDGLQTAIMGTLMAVGCVATVHAAPIAPAAMTAPIGPPVEFVSFWGYPFPVGYAYLRGQCYMYVEEQTPQGIIRRRVWICTEPGGKNPPARF